MRSLFARLALTLVVIITLMGTAFYFFTRHNTKTYYDELSQRLNAPIAMYVTAQTKLIEGGDVNLTAMRELAERAMVINPTAEIYLLDELGNILGRNIDQDALNKTRIDLGPVNSLLGGETSYPIYGNDPSGNDKKIFSAWPIKTGSRIDGYVYVILGGEVYETHVKNIGDSYALRTSVAAILAIGLFTLLFGFVVFGFLTGRLNRLRREMQRISVSGFQATPRLSKVANGGDEIDQLSSTFFDMAAQIKDQIRKLEENDMLRRELVSNISHDLRTPLTAMQGFIETLNLQRKTISEEDRSRYLESAQKHALRLGVLIEDLFELSKLDATHSPPCLESFSLAELAQDIGQSFHIFSERKNIVLQVKTGTPSAMTTGNIELIHRAIENLVKNAIHAAPYGGKVTISISECEDTVAVSIEDNGPGIAEGDLGRIFDRFYKKHKEQDVSDNSSGLGLAIVKRILDLHNTRISVFSELNVGTRFEFELPIASKFA